MKQVREKDQRVVLQLERSCLIGEILRQRYNFQNLVGDNMPRCGAEGSPRGRLTWATGRLVAFPLGW